MVATTVASLVMVVAVAGCGNDEEGATPGLDATAREGEALVQDKGCVSCHSATGEQRTGPTWKGIWGTEVELSDGRTVAVDRAYVARSVGDPSADVVDGFSAVMPTFDLTDTEIDQLVAYLEAIGPGSGQ